MIFDRTPQNDGELRLGWVALPLGAQMCRLVIPRGFGIRGSGDDLRSYFNQLKNLEEAVPRSAFGDVFDGEMYSEWGGG